MIAPGSALSIARQSRLLGVSRSSVYYRPKPESREELDLLKRLDEIFTENPMYGSRRLQVMLRREGVQVGRRRIRTLMRKLGLWAIGPKPNTSRPHPAHRIYPYLLRGLEITRANHVWATDISAPCRRGWRNPNHAGWLPTGSWSAALPGRDTEQKGAAKFCRVLTAGCHKQSSLNCTGREPFFTGRATTAFMVRQRSMRRTPLYLVKQPRQRNGVEAHGVMRPVFVLSAARCGYRI